MPYRLAILALHPIQYQAPLFQRLARDPAIELDVYYGSRDGATPYVDREMGVMLSWDIPILEGYRHHFLTNLARTDKGFFRRVNPGVLTAFRRRRYDAVLVMQGWGTVTAWLAFLACTMSRTPFIIWGDNSFVVERPGALGAARSRLLGALFRRAAGFAVTGVMNGNFYRHYGADPSRFYPVPMAIDNERFARGSTMDVSTRRALRRERGISDDAVVIAMSGKLVENKNPMHLLRAMQQMRFRERAAAIFLGDGRERAALEQFVREHQLGQISFAGFVNQRELPRMYGISDIFAMPSTLDARGLSGNEAMACGLPLVISDRVGLGGPGDIVRHGENGFIFPVGDVAAFAACLDRLVGDDELRRAMGRRSRELIAECDYEANVRGILIALERITGRHAEAGAKAG